MALVRFKDHALKTVETRRMHAPKRATMEAWYKAAQKVLPNIPNHTDGVWEITSNTVSPTLISWTLTKKTTGHKVQIQIDRTVPFMG